MEYQKDNMIDVDYETMQQLVEVINENIEKYILNKIKIIFSYYIKYPFKYPIRKRKKNIEKNLKMKEN
jgi:hypothetical protein